jgi:aminopeptidase-like protein/aminoglycoside N3'-acetyltransferase
MLNKKAIEPLKENSSFEELRDALRSVGVAKGDTLYCHVSLDALGAFEPTDNELASAHLLSCLLEAVGEYGTILVPTYTFSFCRQEEFNITKSPTQKGPWSTSTEFLEFFRRDPRAVRSRDPIYSVAGMGPRAKELLLDLPNTCFGKGSIHHRLVQVGGKICTIGVGLQELTFLHHVEEMADVPSRFKKLYTGYIRELSVPEKTGWICNTQLLTQHENLNGQRLDALFRSSGKCLSAHVGSGEVMCMAAADIADLLSAALASDPWFTTQGPAGNPTELVASPAIQVDLPTNASMSEMIQALWRIPRDIVSEGYDAALRALAGQVPMTTHEFPSGTECWSWIIPEKWKCNEAYLESLDGRRLFSYADNPLHVVSYSLPFEGEVLRRELFEHLHVHHKIPEAIPFIFKYYERDWGLCCSKNQKDNLLDDKYKVVIRSDSSFGTLKVGEVIAPGETDDCIVLCAHLCHSAMVNDDLAGVVVGIKVMRALLSQRNLHYTYRFLIVPETIGSVAYLSQNEELIPKMKGGLFLEMLGLNNPHALQLSFAGNTEVDLCFSQALHDYDPFGWTGAYRAIIGNDERQFNGPGVRVPMLSLSRVLPPTAADWPYREYHSSHDTPDVNSLQNLEASFNLVLRMIETLEGNRVPINRFKGEVFCSRFGLFIDPYSNPEGSRALFDVMDLIDGTQSIAQIARKCSISFGATMDIVNDLHARGLVDYVMWDKKSDARSAAY